MFLFFLLLSNSWDAAIHIRLPPIVASILRHFFKSLLICMQEKYGASSGANPVLYSVGADYVAQLPSACSGSVRC